MNKISVPGKSPCRRDKPDVDGQYKNDGTRTYNSIVRISWLIIMLALISYTSVVAQNCDLYTHFVYTPNYMPVGVIITTEFLDDEIASNDSNMAQHIKDHNWTAVKISPSSATYNCHDYAWDLTEGSYYKVVMAGSARGGSLDCQVDQYFDGTAPAYHQVASASEATKVFYGSGPDHSAVVNCDGTFTSKWSYFGVYKHAPGDCLYSATTLTYYIRNGQSAPICPPPCATTTIQNINYTTSQTITGCNISIQNVTVQNNSTVIFDATDNITINGPFQVQTGSTFQAK
jgi:hypothetical protein